MFALNEFVLFHIAISLIAIGAGFALVGGLKAKSIPPGTTHLFLGTSVAANATGLMFPFTQMMPSHVVAIVSLSILSVSLYAFYGAKLAGGWRRIFAGTAVAALYLNVFVLIAQTFAKNPALAALAPTQSELPFVLTQFCALGVFLRIGQLAVRRAAAVPSASV